MSADVHVHIHDKMFIIRRDHDHLFAESVNDNARQTILDFQLNDLFLTAEHSEALLRVIRHIELFEEFFSFPGFFGHIDVDHFINTVMLDLAFLRIVSYQIIILVIPGQSPRTDVITSPVVPQPHFFFLVPLEILEFYLFIVGNGIMNSIHTVINALVHGLDPAGYIHLTLQFLSIVFSGKGFQLFYQLVGFLYGDKLRRLYCVHKEF